MEVVEHGQSIRTISLFLKGRHRRLPEEIVGIQHRELQLCRQCLPQGRYPAAGCSGDVDTIDSSHVVPPILHYLRVEKAIVPRNGLLFATPNKQKGKPYPFPSASWGERIGEEPWSGAKFLHLPQVHIF